VKKLCFIIATALLVSPFSFCHGQGTGSSNTIARFEVLRSGTNFLTMDVELFDHDRPETVRNFLMYVRSSAYSNLVLQRVETNSVIQAGGVRQNNPRSTAQFFSYTPVTSYGSITNEFSVGPRITNGFGTIAMARISGQTNSASSEWFFNLTDNPFYDQFDGGYTVFGRVINTVNERTGTNALSYFNTVPDGSIRSVFTLSPLFFFPKLPVIYQEEREPAIKDLFYFRISILNDEPRDRTKPKLAITTPVASSITTTNQLIEIAGTAADDRNLLRVIAAEAGKPWVSATGTSNWNFMVRLDPGTNRLTVATLDTWGNQSASSTRTIYYQAPSPISLEILGSGSILGATNGQALNIGYGYTITAQPAAGYYFAGWRTGTGTNIGPRDYKSESMNPKRSFIMAEGYALTAEFIPLPVPVSIAINGSGTISGATNGQTLTLGRTYSVTAKPNPKQLLHRLARRFRNQQSESALDFSKARVPHVAGFVSDR
jgi:cyclophilin family peptidyl-prolyl cis-trans isomerase